MNSKQLDLIISIPSYDDLQCLTTGDHRDLVRVRKPMQAGTSLSRKGLRATLLQTRLGDCRA